MSHFATWQAAFPYPRLWLQQRDGRWRVRRANLAAQKLWQLPAASAAGYWFDRKASQQLQADFGEVLGQLAATKQHHITTAFHAHNLEQATLYSLACTTQPRPNGDTWWEVQALPVAADALQWQRERDDALMLMAAALEASPLGILITDQAGRVVRLNPAFTKVYGYQTRHLLGQDWVNILPPEKRHAAQKIHRALAQGDINEPLEWRVLRPQGGAAAVLATTARLFVGSDRLLLVHSFIDISAHKETEETLRWAKDQADSASRAKSAFLANMSHELRTPLNAIIGFSELMKGETFGPIGHAKYADYMNDIHFAARHLLDIINDVLDMSKIEAGKFELIEETLDVPELLSVIERLLKDRAHHHGITLCQDDLPPLPALYADKRVLRQMLLNVVSNAIKFTPAGKHIYLRSYLNNDGDLAIEVQDEGRGMTDEVLQKVLEPFAQGPEPEISDGRGTGLGLPLTRAMAELHNGYLTMASTPDVGTVVAMIFPKNRLVKALGVTQRARQDNKSAKVAG